MKHIICGTNRPASKSAEVSRAIQALYSKHDTETPEIINLETLNLQNLDNEYYGDKKKPQDIAQAIEKIDLSDGLIVVVPEYNGSFPGALKTFIDHWSYPKSFEYRPVCFIGLGGRFGGLRPVEHLQGVFGYRNAFMYPERVFITNVWDIVKNNEIKDEALYALLEKQTKGFIKFVKALNSENLHANSLTEPS